MRERIGRLATMGFAALFVLGLAGSRGRAVYAQGSKSAPADKSTQTIKPEIDTSKFVLLRKEQLDVNDDGVLDTVAYFDADGDGVCDAEAIDVGSTGKISLLALRIDASGSGRADDWVVVNSESDTVVAVLLDTDHDGEVDSVALPDGRVVALPEGNSGRQITAGFKY